MLEGLKKECATPLVQYKAKQFRAIIFLSEKSVQKCLYTVHVAVLSIKKTLTSLRREILKIFSRKFSISLIIGTIDSECLKENTSYLLRSDQDCIFQNVD